MNGTTGPKILFLLLYVYLFLSPCLFLKIKPKLKEWNVNSLIPKFLVLPF